MHIPVYAGQEDQQLIIALEDAKYKLQNLRGDMKELGSSLRIEELHTTVAELEAKTMEENFWGDQENSSKILQTIKQTKDKIEAYEALCAKYRRSNEGSASQVQYHRRSHGRSLPFLSANGCAGRRIYHSPQSLGL